MSTRVEELFKSKKNTNEIIRDFAKESKPEDPLIKFWIERKRKSKPSKT